MDSRNHPVEPEELMAYLDGELPAPQAAQAAEHLAHCRDCQSVAADLQGVTRRLMAWQVELPGKDWKAPVEAMATSPAPVKSVAVTKGWLRRRWPWTVAAAGVGLVLLMLVAPLSRKYPDQLAPRAAAYLAAPEQATPAPQAAKPISNPPDQDATPPGNDGPLIVHTAQMSLATTDFPKTREAMEALVARHGGHLAELTINSPAGSGRSLHATLRIPAPQLPAFLGGLRALARVETESQMGEEVTRQVTDLEARLANSRNTEQRLAAILRNNTGKISDVLEVEKEIDRVRGEIERMEAQRKNLRDRVAYATVNVTVGEEYREGLQVTPPSAGRELRNSAVEGWRNLAGSLFGVAQFLLAAGPVLLVWAAILFFPARWIWRRTRRKRSVEV